MAEPSYTARRVAALRAHLERLPAEAGGDPAAEARLVASLTGDGTQDPPSERMRRHLQARTRFFDRVVVNAIGRGARQVVILGAGYDARALRYAAPGVRFFEVDHPDTQADKRDRLDALGLDRSAIAFVAVDLAAAWLDAALREAGFDADAPAAILCEGLLAYLSPPSIQAMFDALRALAAPGTRLALSVAAPGRRDTAWHARLREELAARGEPAGNDLDVDDVRDELPYHRWRPVDLPERAAKAGFLVAAPKWAPAPVGAPASAGRVARYLEMMHRDADGLAAHLSAEHGLVDPALRELDVGVYDARCVDGRRLIVRLSPAARPAAAVARDAALLHELGARGYPAEQPAAPAPVGEHAGQSLLITEHVTGRRAPADAAGWRCLGDLLGRLQTLEGLESELAPGGAWHHLVPAGGPPGAELAAVRGLLAAARARVGDADAAGHAWLTELLAEADDCAGLPEALLHPDFVPANALGLAPVIIDWAGCGRGPRLWPLAWLLWAAGERSAAAAMEGYATHVALESEERERLGGAMLARPAVLAAWEFATGRRSLADAAAVVRELPTAAERVAARALAGG